eukprot:253392_1
MREEFERTLKQTNDENKLMKQSNNDTILLLLESENAYIGGIQSGKKQKVEIVSFMNEDHWKYCMGNDIGFSAAKQIEFNAKDINVIGNNIVFGVSNKKISALSMKSKICKTFTGNISFDLYTPIYCNNFGLMVVGGENINDDTIPKKK